MHDRPAAALVQFAQSEHFRLLVSALPIMIWSTDREFRVTSVAGALLDSLNIAADDVVGNSVFAEQDPHAPIEQYARRALAGECVQYENEWRGRTLAVHWQPLRDETGAIIGTVAMAQDVTRERTTTNELRDNRRKLHESVRQLHDLSTRLNEVREQEYGRISREIHDQFGQSLTALRLDLEEVGRRLDRSDLAGVRQRLLDMRAILDGCREDIHRLASDLRPPILDELGFEAAAMSYLEDVGRRADLRCEFHGPGEPLRMSPDRAMALFRILQEAITNVIRHARATRLDVAVARDGTLVRLSVRDDGVGLPASGRGLGLSSMRDRAHLLGGQVRIEAAPGGGTVVEAAVPVHEAPLD